MEIKIEDHIERIKSEGITILSSAYSQEQCESCKKRVLKIMEWVEKTEGKERLNLFCRAGTPFYYDHSLLEFIYHKTLDSILKVLIDDFYVLTMSNINNLSQVSDSFSESTSSTVKEKKTFNGGDWHTDSRFIGGKRMEPGFNYTVILMLDDFSVRNGATQYVPDSLHLRSRPEPRGNYDFKTIEGRQGSLVIMDAALWHRSGNKSEMDRWAVLNQYGPWFMKPYFRYNELMGEEFGKTTTPVFRRLLHYNSMPPLSEKERVSTLVRESES